MKEPRGVRRTVARWKLRTRTLELGRRTLVMGIVNMTPDSFSDGGLFLDPEAAVAHALQLLDEGADLLDLGAESTRPGSRAGLPSAEAAGAAVAPAVSAEQEQARLLPVLKGILQGAAGGDSLRGYLQGGDGACGFKAGAEIINDVSGFFWDSELGACVRRGRMRRGSDAHARTAGRVGRPGTTRFG